MIKKTTLLALLATASLSYAGEPSKAIPCSSNITSDCGHCHSHEEGHDHGKHYHYSENGTPRAHFFLMEPASQGRDLLYAYAEAEDAHELELELPFDNKFTLIIGGAYVGQQNQFTDIAGEIRYTYIDHGNYIGAVSLGYQLPTGDPQLTDDEYSNSLNFTNWFELAPGLGLQTRLGVGHAYESETTNAFTGIGVSYNLIKGDNVNGHVHKNELNITAEYARSFEVSNTGNYAHNAAFGIHYNITSNITLRGAYIVDLKNNDEPTGFVLGGVYHF